MAGQSAQVRGGQVGQRARLLGSGQNQGDKHAGQKARDIAQSVRGRAVFGRRKKQRTDTQVF